MQALLIGIMQVYLVSPESIFYYQKWPHLSVNGDHAYISALVRTILDAGGIGPDTEVSFKNYLAFTERFVRSLHAE